MAKDIFIKKSISDFKKKHEDNISSVKKILINTTDKYDDKTKKRVPIPDGMIKQVYLESKGKCQNKKCKISIIKIKPDIHHKNLDPSDNRIENLLLICPNCHRQMHYNADGTKKTLEQKTPKTKKTGTKKKPKKPLSIKEQMEENSKKFMKGFL